MESFFFLCLLGLLGGIAGSAADVLCVKAVRYPAHAWPMVIAGSILLGLGGPIWYAMSKLSGGQYVRPAIAWTIASTACVIVAVWVCDGQQTPRQWCGFALILVGALVRG